jgi:hypothetical protein
MYAQHLLAPLSVTTVGSSACGAQATGTPRQAGQGTSGSNPTRVVHNTQVVSKVIVCFGMQCYAAPAAQRAPGQLTLDTGDL